MPTFPELNYLFCRVCQPVCQAGRFDVHLDEEDDQNASRHGRRTIESHGNESVTAGRAGLGSEGEWNVVRKHTREYQTRSRSAAAAWERVAVRTVRGWRFYTLAVTLPQCFALQSGGTNAEFCWFRAKAAFLAAAGSADKLCKRVWRRIRTKVCYLLLVLEVLDVGEGGS